MLSPDTKRKNVLFGYILQSGYSVIVDMSSKILCQFHHFPPSEALVSIQNVRFKSYILNVAMTPWSSGCSRDIAIGSRKMNFKFGLSSAINGKWLVALSIIINALKSKLLSCNIFVYFVKIRFGKVFVWHATNTKLSYTFFFLCPIIQMAGLNCHLCLFVMLFLGNIKFRSYSFISSSRISREMTSD